MCQLIVCKKGTDKNSDFLFQAIRIASVRNSDGMGFAFKRSRQKRIYISKGYTSVEPFIALLKKKNLKEDDELIVHLRIGNKGAKGVQMCHPFVLSNENEIILSNDIFVDEGVMAHNGTLIDFGEYNSMFSDTFVFVKEFMSLPEIQSLLKRDRDLFVKTFKFTLKSNKLAFIFPDSPLITIGDFTEDKGYLFSNVSYKRSDYEDIGGYGQWKGGNPAVNSSNYRHFIDNDEEDEITIVPDTKPIPIGQNRIDFGSHHETPITNNQTKAIQNLIAQGKATKVGERTRDTNGLLEVDPKLDLIPPKGIVGLSAIYSKPMRNWLYPSTGRMIYVPLRYMSNQFERSFFNPCIFNYDHFTYYSPLVSDSEFNVSPRLIYKICQFDDTRSPKSDRAPIQGLNSTDYDPNYSKSIVNTIWLTNDEMIANLNQTVKSEVRNSYLTVYRLCKRFSNPSKNLYGQLVKAIAGAEKRNKDSEINFKNEGGLRLLGLKIYANYVIQACYEWDVAKHMFYKVQSVDQDKSISLLTAIKAFNKRELVN